MNTPKDAIGATHTIAGALITIGEDPGSVAQVMRQFGCCGAANDPADNPITDFLARYGIRSTEIAWNGRGYICRTDAYEQDVAVPLPDPVAMFMEQFNQGHWPEFDVTA